MRKQVHALLAVLALTSASVRANEASKRTVADDFSLEISTAQTTFSLSEAVSIDVLLNYKGKTPVLVQCARPSEQFRIRVQPIGKTTGALPGHTEKVYRERERLQGHPLSAELTVHDSFYVYAPDGVSSETAKHLLIESAEGDVIKDILKYTLDRATYFQGAARFQLPLRQYAEIAEPGRYEVRVDVLFNRGQLQMAHSRPLILEFK